MQPLDCVACNQVALTIKRLRSILLKGVDAEPLSLLDTICGLLDIAVCPRCLMRSLIRVLGPHYTRRSQRSAPPGQHRQQFETCLA